MSDLIISPSMLGVTPSIFPIWVRFVEMFAAPLEIEIEITSESYSKTRVFWMYKEQGRKATMKFKGKPFSSEQLIVALLGDRNATRLMMEERYAESRSALPGHARSRWHKDSHSSERSVGLALSTLFGKRTELYQEVTADEATRLSLGIFGGKETGARIKLTVKGREQFCRELVQQLLMSKNVLFSAFFGDQNG
jgi:hypothetical protein